MGARFTATAAGALSGVSLLLVPLALGLQSGGSGVGEAGTMWEAFEGAPAFFTAAVLAWSFGATAQGPALTAIGQELAPRRAEAEALALPRAAGDAMYIGAPFLLGLVADAAPGMGFECAFAGGAVLLGTLALMLL